MAINKDELTLLSPLALISISVSQSSSFSLRFIDPPVLKSHPPHLTCLPPYIFLFLPHSSFSSALCKKLLSSLHSPHLSFLLQFLSAWHSSPSCAGLWTPGLPLTPSFIRSLKSRNHSLLSSAGRCHLLRYPSHLADDQYKPFPSALSLPLLSPSPPLPPPPLLHTVFLWWLALCSLGLCEKTELVSPIWNKEQGQSNRQVLFNVKI